MAVRRGDLHIAGKEKAIIQSQQNISKDMSLTWSPAIPEGMRYSHLERERLVLKGGTWDL